MHSNSKAMLPSLDDASVELAINQLDNASLALTVDFILEQLKAYIKKNQDVEYLEVWSEDYPEIDFAIMYKDGLSPPTADTHHNHIREITKLLEGSVARKTALGSFLYKNYKNYLITLNTTLLDIDPSLYNVYEEIKIIKLRSTLSNKVANPTGPPGHNDDTDVFKV